MKKIYTTVAFACIAAAMSAQSQRLVLAEEFTQASCGPCAAQNPAFNTLLAANTTKVVSIKYQTNWPGVDPMNVQTQTDVGTRVTYYGVTGVPHAVMDGVAQTGSSYTGAPANWTQSAINTEYGVPSPFTVNVSHMLSNDLDSVYITCVITASQNYTAVGTLKGHVVLVEKTISFSTPPGSNGEMDFYSVERKMYPSASGTTLPSSWSNGNSQTITVAAALPNYIYDKGQLAVVAFVEDDGNKIVQQAGLSDNILLVNDAAASAISGVPSLTCTGTFTPSVTLDNNGSATMTSCTINYQVDSNTPATYSWTGSLASGASTTVTLPAVTAAAGSHTFKAWPTMPNGVADNNTNYDTQTTNFTVNTGSGVAAPLSNNISATGFPYANWTLNNPDASTTWARVTTNTGSLKYDCFSYGTVGAIDEFTVEPVDLSTATNASVSFDVAHAQYSASYTDALEVLISTDCGATWTSVWTKSGATLATATATTSAFTPTATQWRTECIDLSSYVGQNKVFVMFRGINGYGNNIYVDNININNAVCATGIASIAASNSFNVFPNPSNGNTNVNLNLVDASDVTIKVYDMLGKTVYSDLRGKMASGNHMINIDGSKFEAGIYFVTVTTGDKTMTQKISVTK